MSTMLTSREFNQDSSRAKKLSEKEPVIITNRGKPAHVLMSFDQYNKLLNQQSLVTDLLGMDEDVDFEPEKLKSSLIKTVDLS